MIMIIISTTSHQPPSSHVIVIVFVALFSHVEVWKDSLSTKQREPYLSHHFAGECFTWSSFYFVLVTMLPRRGSGGRAALRPVRNAYNYNTVPVHFFVGMRMCWGAATAAAFRRLLFPVPENRISTRLKPTPTRAANNGGRRRWAAP